MKVAITIKRSNSNHKNVLMTNDENKQNNKKTKEFLQNQWDNVVLKISSAVLFILSLFTFLNFTFSLKNTLFSIIVLFF
ncbi:hypothetical protein G5O_0841 [Chlamydia psittaci 6BC]|nr:hypothetical protein G5O_0841 [Chlamydia psittaci 6BC]KPZ37534.1 hypothetical protein GWG_02615 [Chlamydia psittaci DD34]